MRTVLQRLFSILGALLVLLGCGILAYIGVTYARQASPVVRTWTTAESSAGHKLQTHLTGTQKVTIPRSSAGVAPGAPGVRMVIPAISVDAAVVQTAPQGGVWNVADWVVGHLASTPNPGVPGNGAYAAHDDIKGELFKRLGELKPGDPVLVYAGHTVYRYAVTAQRTVDPSDVSVLAPTRLSTVTLITCAPYWVDTQRLVVQATLKSSSPA